MKLGEKSRVKRYSTKNYLAKKLAIKLNLVHLKMVDNAKKTANPPYRLFQV